MRQPPRHSKGSLQEFLHGHDIPDDVTPWLFNYVFWLEGQDKPGYTGGKEFCRYHVVEAKQNREVCPFRVGEGNEQ